MQRMKSSGTIVGAARFAELCRELENMAIEGAFVGAESLVSKVEEEYRRVEEELRIILDEYR